jgi:hypothetical protein
MASGNYFCVVQPLCSYFLIGKRDAAAAQQSQSKSSKNDSHVREVGEKVQADMTNINDEFGSSDER